MSPSCCIQLVVVSNMNTEVVSTDSQISYSLLLCLTGGNGEPVATSALPSVQSYRSCGLASWSVVGFESGKMTGRSTCFAISRTTSSEKDPGLVEVPMSTCGFTSLMTDSRSPCSLPSHSLSSRANGSWAGVSWSFLPCKRRPGLSTHLIEVSVN